MSHQDDVLNESLGSRYVLATAAYNEEQHIRGTLDSVVSQELPPHRWIVVSDGSTDRTDEIVRDYAARYPYIELLRVEKEEKHDFAAKVHALHKAFERLAGTPYDFIGVLDADLSFEPGYFARLLEEFHRNARLGVGGGHIEQLVDGVVVPRVKDLGSVAGGVQLLRRECMEATGGLPPLKYGGEDAALEIAARMHGWETRTFPHLRVTHQGFVGIGAGSPLRARFKWGRMNFSLGYDPLYEVARCGYRVIERPYFVGSVAELAGFAFAWAQQRGPDVDRELVDYLRREQRAKLLALLR